MTTCTRHLHVKYFVNVTDPVELVVQLIAWLDKICFYRIIQQKKNSFFDVIEWYKNFLRISRMKNVTLMTRKIPTSFCSTWKRHSVFNTSEGAALRSFQNFDINFGVKRVPLQIL